MEHILWKHFIVYGAVLSDPHFKCGSRSISYLLPLDRALNSDHFCLVKFEDPSIYSGTFWRKMDLFGKKLPIFGQFFIFFFLKILVTFEPQNRFHFSKGWSGSADSSFFGWKRKPNWKLNLDNYTFFKAWKSMKWLKSYDLFIANVSSKHYNIISCWHWVF